MESRHIRRGLHRRLPPWLTPTGSNAPVADPQPTTEEAPAQRPTTSSSTTESTTPTPQSQATTSTSSATPTTTSTSTTAETTSSTTTSETHTKTSDVQTTSSTSSTSSSSSTSSTPITITTPTLRATSVGTSTVIHTTTPTSVRFTSTISTLTASANSSASASATPSSGSSANTGVIVGGIGAGIVGIAVLIFAATWFMRRSRRDDDFNAEDFRRQSTMLPDPDPDTPGMRGMAPRPPSMIQQHLDAPVLYGAPQQYGNAYYGAGGYSGYPEQMSFAPGQVMPVSQPLPPSAWSPDTPHTSQPFFHAMGGVESPIGSPVSVQPYDSAYDAHGNLMRTPSTGPNAYLSRQPSMNAAAHVPMDSYDANEAHYVDLNRSSVSPFQAAQYAEISHRLNAEPPAPLPTPVIAAAADEVITKGNTIVPDVADPKPLNIAPTTARSPFSDPQSVAINEEEDNVLPQPPSPAYPNKSRVDSTPPTLPQQRTFSPVNMDFPVSVKSPQGPSPLAAAPVTGVPNQPEPAVIANLRPQKDAAARPDTVYTLYDDDDAYAAI